MDQRAVLEFDDKFFISSHEDRRILRYIFISQYFGDAPACFYGTSEIGLVSIQNLA